MIPDSRKHVWVGTCWTHANVSGWRMMDVSNNVSPLAKPPFLILIPSSMLIQNYSRFTPKKVLSILFSIHLSLVGFIPSSTREHCHWRNHISYRRACAYKRSSYQLTAGSLYIFVCAKATSTILALCFQLHVSKQHLYQFHIFVSSRSQINQLN